MFDVSVFDDLQALVREKSPRHIETLDDLVKYDGGCADYVLDVIVNEDIPVPLQTFRKLEKLVAEGFDDYQPEWGTTIRDDLRPLVKELALKDFRDSGSPSTRNEDIR